MIMSFTGKGIEPGMPLRGQVTPMVRLRARRFGTDEMRNTCDKGAPPTAFAMCDLYVSRFVIPFWSTRVIWISTKFTVHCAERTLPGNERPCGHEAQDDAELPPENVLVGHTVHIVEAAVDANDPGMHSKHTAAPTTLL